MKAAAAPGRGMRPALPATVPVAGGMDAGGGAGDAADAAVAVMIPVTGAGGAAATVTGEGPAGPAD